MSHAVYSEWTKLRTVLSTGWLALAAVVTTVAVSALAVGSVNAKHCPSPTECFEDTTKLSLTGVGMGQVALVVLGVLVMSSEYGTRMIQVTLAANPRRSLILAAKLVVVTATALVSGALGVAGSLLVARNILPRNGFTTANGYPPLSLADGPTLRAAGGSVLYLALIAALSVGVGAILRDTAVAITTVLGLLYVFPMLAMFVSDPLWQHRLQKFSPMSAGLAIQATKSLHTLPIAPWAGLGLLAAYAAAAALIGAVLFHLRDA